MSDSWDHIDCSPPGSSVHGIFPTRIQECIAISFSRGSSRPRDQTCISYIDRFFTTEPPGKLCWDVSKSTAVGWGWRAGSRDWKLSRRLNCEAAVINWMSLDDPNQEPGLILQVKESESVSCSVVSNSL